MGNIAHFRNLVNICPNGTYVGIGNPESNILIVGMENAINRTTNPNRARYEIDENIDEWKEILRHLTGNRQFRESKSKLTSDFIYNPRKGYQYQFPSSMPLPNPLLYSPAVWSRKGIGVGSTWFYYQRLLNGIAPRTSIINPEPFDLFDRCFMTELNDFVIPNHSSITKCQKDAIDSAIQNRTTNLFNHPFFKSFDIVFLSCSKYIKGGSTIPSIFSNGTNRVFVMPHILRVSTHIGIVNACNKIKTLTTAGIYTI